MSNKKRILILAMIYIVIFYIGCGNIQDDAELRKIIDTYYRLEKEKNWKQTYYFRTPTYRHDVSLDTYIMGMERGSKDWHFVKYEIKKIRIQDEYAEVDIYFLERNIADEYIKIITQTTSWEKIDGIWYGKDVGTRLHLPFNFNTR